MRWSFRTSGCIVVKPRRGEIRYLALAPLLPMLSRFPYKPWRKTILNPIYRIARRKQKGGSERSRRNVKRTPEQRRDTKSRNVDSLSIRIHARRDDSNYKRGNWHCNAIVRAFSLTITAKGDLMCGLIMIISPIRNTVEARMKARQDVSNLLRDS